MLQSKPLLFVLALATILKLQAAAVSTGFIQYHVIKALNDTDEMGVIVDDTVYPLHPNKDVAVIHSGKAPVANVGYKYVRIDKDKITIADEPFIRKPSRKNTPYEFFNRTTNIFPMAEMPKLYAPLPTINKIETSLHPENEIHTVFVQGDEADLERLHKQNMTDDLSIMVNVSYITLHDVHTFDKVKLSLSGRSSRWMPKFSYGIKLAKNDRLHGYRHLKLRSLASDPSYLREKIVYDAIRSAGLLSSGFSYNRLIMNNQELGLFGLVETFKHPWIANSFGGGDTKHATGNLYQASYSSGASAALNLTSDLSYYANITHYQLGQYELREKSSTKDQGRGYVPLQDFTHFIAEAYNSTSSHTSNSIDSRLKTGGLPHQTSVRAKAIVNVEAIPPSVIKETGIGQQWRKHLNTDSFLRSMALEVLLGWADGYLIMADNYYLYQNPKENNAFFYIPTDFDMTMGNSFFNISDQYSGNYSTVPNALTRPLFKALLEVTEFKQQFEGYLKDMAKKLISPAILTRRIDDIVNMIRRDVEWDQHECTHIGSSLFAELGYRLEDIPLDDIKNHPEKLEPDLAQMVGTGIPKGVEFASMIDLMKRFNQSISFDAAVSGPIEGHPSLVSIRDFIKRTSENTLAFYRLSSDAATV